MNSTALRFMIMLNKQHYLSNDSSGSGTKLVSTPNSSEWVSTNTLRFFGADGRANFDIDCPGQHHFGS